MDIYCYWIDVDFFFDQAQTFFSTFWTSGSKNLLKKCSSFCLSVCLSVCEFICPI